MRETFFNVFLFGIYSAFDCCGLYMWMYDFALIMCLSLKF